MIKKKALKISKVHSAPQIKIVIEFILLLCRKHCFNTTAPNFENWGRHDSRGHKIGPGVLDYFMKGSVH